MDAPEPELTDEQKAAVNANAREYYRKMARSSGIPAYMIEHLVKYIIDRHPIGGFLTAVFSNDLMDALGRADDVNINCLKNYGTFIYNAAPRACWGSREAVATWLGQ